MLQNVIYIIDTYKINMKNKKRLQSHGVIPPYIPRRPKRGESARSLFLCREGQGLASSSSSALHVRGKNRQYL